MSEPSLPAFENHPPRARRSRRRKTQPSDPSNDTAAAVAAAEAPAPASSEDDLLADPETIAGKPSPRKRRKAKASRAAVSHTVKAAKAVETVETQPALEPRPANPQADTTPRSQASTTESAEPTPTADRYVSEALSTLRQKWGRAESTARSDSAESTHGSGEPETGPRLLDAASARALAAEARKREQACREALEQARRELTGPLGRSPGADTAAPAAASIARPVATPVATPTAKAEAPAAGGWQTRSLGAEAGAEAQAETRVDRSDPPRHDSRTPSAEASARGPVASEAFESSDFLSADRLRGAFDAAQRELRELNATLEIARDTASQQKRDLAELRARLSASEASNAELTDTLAEVRDEARAAETARALDLRRDLEAAHQEIDRLRERLRAQTRDAETQEQQRVALERSLEERDAALAARNAQLEDLRDRFEAQDRALEDARREYDRERARHSENLERLAEVRATLAGIAAQAGLAPAEDRPGEPRDARLPRGSELAATRPPRELDAIAAAPVVDAVDTTDTKTSPPRAPSDSSVADECAPSVPPAMTAPDERPGLRPRPSADRANALPAIFDAWQDDHIRREFGPMGIDSFYDLLATPLGRRANKRQAEQPIVLIGRGAWRASLRLAESLVTRGTGPFRIHVADPAGIDAHGDERLSEDSPFTGLVQAFDCPLEADTLDGTLEAIAPSVVICRDFLSRLPQIDPWLSCLERVVERGGSLVLSEGTGVELHEPPEEMSRIGERIWELMPERYTRVGDDDRRIESWREAFASSETRTPNGLVAQIRERFRPEMFTQFGFLAEPFLTSAIGANFDPDAPRDRRFLRQVADLDDRKIEASLAPALHLATLIDPLFEDA